MLNTERSIVDEVEAAIKIGSPEKSLETVRRVTDLFLLSAGSFNGEQIELFDNVLERLIKTIELRAIADVSARIALAETSTQLASIAQAPPGVIRRLAQHDEITVAGPVLTESSPPDPGRSARDRQDQRRAASARRLRALVAAGNRHRRAVGAPLSERQPPRREKSRRARLSQRICHRRGAGRSRS